MKLISASGQHCELKVTQREGAGYKWVNCLAILDSAGQWMLSMHWRTNHKQKAIREALEYGFKVANT